MNSIELRDRRLQLGWSQMLLARYLGIDRTTVNNWESSRRTIPLLAVRAMLAQPEIEQFLKGLTEKERRLITNRLAKVALKPRRNGHGRKSGQD